MTSDPHSSLLSTSTHSSKDALRTQWPEAVSELAPDDVALVRRLLDAVSSTSDVEVQVHHRPGGEWQVGVCLADRVGTLSLVSGLLTAHGLDIVHADTFTVVHSVPAQAQTAPSRRRAQSLPRTQIRRRTGGHLRKQKIPRRRHSLPRAQIQGQTPTPWAVMLFSVRSRSDGLPDWEAFRNDIERAGRQSAAGEFDAARLEVIERFSHTMQASPLFPRMGKLPLDIATDNATSDDHSLLEITSSDTPGFLFAFSIALSSVRVNVVRSRIRTDGDRVRDTFWLTEPSGEKVGAGLEPARAERRLEQIRAAAALIKQFTHLLPTAPDPGQALRQFNLLTSQLLSHPDWSSEFEDLESPGVLETLAEMMGSSRFLWEEFLRVQHENLFPVLLDVPGLYSSRSRAELAASIESLLSDCSDHDQRVRALNDLKDREMFRIDLRYITDRIDRRQFGAELSTLAEVVVEKAFELSIASVGGGDGAPDTYAARSQAPCAWAVLALGKFGGSDMGFGSDLELIFVYEAEGHLSGEGDGPRPARAIITGGDGAPATSAAKPRALFFTEAVREFLRVLETRQQGVFEVDMRLRPFGSKGALASSLAAVEDYYDRSGDDFARKQLERLALVRMRPVAGDEDLGRRVMRIRDSFVYSSEPLDVDDIRRMRRRQAVELVERGAVNAKLSPGGMVDIEYYVQAWQIARGGEDRSVRLTNTLDALDALRSGGHIDAELAGRIGDSYRFFLALVDALRVVRGNASDLNIPRPDTREFHHLAHRLSVEPPDLLSRHVEDHMASSRSLWDELRPPGPLAM